MTTNDLISKILRKRPVTKREIADALMISEKTVKNRLGEIHRDNEGEFAAFVTRGNRNSTRYAILDTAKRIPMTKTIHGSKYILKSATGTLEGGIYSTIVYSR